MRRQARFPRCSVFTTVAMQRNLVTTMNERILYGAWVSPYFSLVAQVLREADLEFGCERVSPFTGENRGEANNARNPLGKIPSLQDSSGIMVSESLAICRYLARTCPSARVFYPTEDAARCARVDTLADYINFSVGGPFFTWFVVGAHFPLAWRLDTAEESRVFGQWSAMLTAGELRRLLDAYAPDPFLLGSMPTLADFQLFYILEHGRMLHRLVDDANYNLMSIDPRLGAFYEAVAERPATQWVLAEREAEFELSRREYFEEMEAGFRPMLDGLRPFLEALFGHPV